MNLVVNARDAMPNGGKLTIETSNVTIDQDCQCSGIEVAPGEHVRLTISDTGSGMTEEVKARIFEPFFTTKEEGKGTGLGLATCYSIVTHSSGHLQVCSELGNGTTFEIYLPRVEEAVDPPSDEVEEDCLPRGMETILLAEDEPLLLNMVASIMRDLGYTVLPAINGQEALRLAQKHAGQKIHLLLTDVVMPQMGGIELANRLRATRPDTNVLLTWGHSDNAIVQQGELDPNVGFIPKPFLPTAYPSRAIGCDRRIRGQPQYPTQDRVGVIP